MKNTPLVLTFLSLALLAAPASAQPLAPMPPVGAGSFEDLFAPQPARTYFQHADRFPFSQDKAGKFDAVNAWWLAEASLGAKSMADSRRPSTRSGPTWSNTSRQLRATSGSPATALEVRSRPSPLPVMDRLHGSTPTDPHALGPQPFGRLA